VVCVHAKVMKEPWCLAVRDPEATGAMLVNQHAKRWTIKPQFPKQFGNIEDAKNFCRAFFDWYNQRHHHLGIGLMTPDQVHYGQAELVHAPRQKTLDHAFRANPIRFVNIAPEPPQMPTAV